MIYYKSLEEIELIRNSSLLVSKTLAEVAKNITVGLPTVKLDQIADSYIRDNGGIPAFKDYKGFPASVCISINEEVVHGIPGDRELKDGDVVSVDCGVLMDGFYGDSAFSFALGNVAQETLELLDVTYESLNQGIAHAVHGNRLGDISFAIQNYTEKEREYSVVRELVGHGIGENLHEEPEVANYGRKGKGLVLKEGLVIAIEPMINLGKKNVVQSADGWTIMTVDKSPSAHFEHTIVVKKAQAEVLSTFEYIMDAVKNNHEIQEIRLKS